MRSTLVRFATPVSTPQAVSLTRAAQKPTRVASKKRREPPLSLEHFLLRSRVRGLYRNIVRAIYQIPDPSARKDPIAHAKGEFARNKDVRDVAQIRYLVSTGKAEWDGMRRYVEELAIMAKRG